MDDLDNPWAASSEPDQDCAVPSVSSSGPGPGPGPVSGSAAVPTPHTPSQSHLDASAADPSAALSKLSLAAVDDDDGPAWGLEPSSPAAPVPAAGANSAPHPASAAPHTSSAVLPIEPEPKAMTRATPQAERDPDVEAETVEDPWAPPPWGASPPSPPPARPHAQPAVVPVHAPSTPTAPPSPPPFAPASLSLSPTLDDDASPWGPPPAPESFAPPPEASTMTASTLQDTLHKRFADPEAEADATPLPVLSTRSQESATGASDESGKPVGEAIDKDQQEEVPATGGVLSKLKGMMSKSGSSTPNPNPNPNPKSEGAAHTFAELASPMSPAPASRASASSSRLPASPTAQPAPWLARLKANQKHSRTGSNGDLTSPVAESNNAQIASAPGFKQVTNNAPTAPRGTKAVLSSWLSGSGAKPQVVSAADDEDDDDLVSGVAPAPAAAGPARGPTTAAAGQDLLSFDPQPAKPPPSTGGSWWSNLKARASSGAGAGAKATGNDESSATATAASAPTAFGSSDLDWLESASSKPPPTLLGGGAGQVDLLGDTAAHVAEIGYGSSGLGSEAERFAPATTSTVHEPESLASSLLGSGRRKPLSRAEQEKLRSLQMAAASSTGGYKDASDDVGPSFGTRYDYDDFDADPAHAHAYSDTAPPKPTSKHHVPASAPAPTSAPASSGASLAPPVPSVSDLLGDLSTGPDESFGDFAQPMPAPPPPPSTALDSFADLTATPVPRLAAQLQPPSKAVRNASQSSATGLSWLPPPPGRQAAHGHTGSGRGTPLPPPAPPAAPTVPASNSVADDMKLLADL